VEHDDRFKDRLETYERVIRRRRVAPPAGRGVSSLV
jgi:hypothetical protein